MDIFGLYITDLNWDKLPAMCMSWVGDVFQWKCVSAMVSTVRECPGTPYQYVNIYKYNKIKTRVPYWFETLKVVKYLHRFKVNQRK